MPHTGHILHGRYAVVSCHVERPLDDDVWSRFGALQERGPAVSRSQPSCGRRRDGRERGPLARAGAGGAGAWALRAAHALDRTGPRAADRRRSGSARARAGTPGSTRPASSRPSSAAAAGTSTTTSGRSRRSRLRGLHRDRVPSRLPGAGGSAPAAARSRSGSSSVPAPACSSCRRRIRSACSRAAVLGRSADRSCTRTSTTPTCSTVGALRLCGSACLPRTEANGDGSRRASAGLAAREDDVVREQPCVKRHEPSCDEMQVHVLEAVEEGAHVAGGEHLQMRGVVLRLDVLCRKRSLFFRR